MSAKWSLSFSDAYLFTHEIFKDEKKDRTSIRFRPPSVLGPYMIIIEFIESAVDLKPNQSKIRFPVES